MIFAWQLYVNLLSSLYLYIIISYDFKFLCVGRLTTAKFAANGLGEGREMVRFVESSSRQAKGKGRNFASLIIPETLSLQTL